MSRTNVRSAHSHTACIALRRVGSMLAPVGYVFAVLLLFNFTVFFCVFHFYESVSLPESRWVPFAEAKAVQSAQSTIGLPVRIKIPTIHVNARIDHVGLMPDGSMGVPRIPGETAWYMLGPKPGHVGSAVIDGHVNWWYGARGVFENLKNLKKGDVITVQDDRGVTISFVVRAIRTIGQKEDASDVFRSYDGKAHLNLVTCAGTWDRAAKIYSKRLIVFADKVE